MVTKQIEDLADEVQRNSNQPRFNTKDKSSMFWSVYSWVKKASQVEPPYAPNSSKRDKWLREYVRNEPFLHGVLASVVSVDKNRGWSLLGAEHLVRKYVNRLHKLHAAPDQRGWRPFTGFLSHSYHCADIGAIAEIEWTAVDVRMGFHAELNSLYTVDPSHCRLTGNMEYPLAYTADDLLKLDPQEWNTNAYFRMVDNINTDATMNGLGICAISRALELAKILTALYEHDAEQLLSKAPRGLLLLNGISEEQWEETLQARIETMTEMEKKYYTGVQVIAGNGLEKVQAELVSLSQIPNGLDHVEFTNLVMNLYALAFKYDPREFWPVSGGQLGTATETETQHKKATGKGGMDFILTYQENLQDLLPHTIEFEFEARDIDGEIKDESLTHAIIQNIVALGDAGYIDIEQAKIMLAEAEIIHKEWANSPHQVTTDQEDNPESGHAGEHLFDAKTETLSFLNSPQGEPSLAFLKQQRSPVLDFLKKRNSKLVHQTSSQPRLEDLVEVDNEAIARSLFYFPDQRIVKYVERDGLGKYMPIQIKRKARPFYSFKERKNITDHDGSMIAIFIPKMAAVRLRAIADGLGLPEDTLQELASNMHVTLAFFPDNDFSDPVQLSKAEVVSQIALSRVKTLDGTIQGYGIFNGGKKGPVLYASVDIPELNALRAELCEHLDRVGLDYAKDHGFTPHITLAYLGSDYQLPEGFQVPDIPVSIESLTIVSGKQRTEVPLDFSREGKGKGNWGHAGRPDQVGGSAPAGVREGWDEYKRNLFLKNRKMWTPSAIGVGKYSKSAMDETVTGIQDRVNLANDLNDAEIISLLKDDMFATNMLGCANIFVSRLSESSKVQLGKELIEVLAASPGYNTEGDKMSGTEKAKEFGFGVRNYTETNAFLMTAKATGLLEYVSMSATQETRDQLVEVYNTKEHTGNGFELLGKEAETALFLSEPSNPREYLVSRWTSDASHMTNPLLANAAVKALGGTPPGEVYWNMDYMGMKLQETPPWIDKEAKAIYEETQAFYTKKKFPPTLWRAVKTEVVIESPISSWSKSQATVNKFGDFKLTKTVNPKAIFMSFESMATYWGEADLAGKKEFVMIGEQFVPTVEAP